MKTEREIILDSLAGALSAHNPNWAVIPNGVDPVRDAIYAAVVAVSRAYPAPAEPIAGAVFADFFARGI